MNDTGSLPARQSWAQRLVLAFVPQSVAASMEAESRQWILRCACGHEQSVWDSGGIRWKAAGRPCKWRYCPVCGRMTWQSTEWRDAPDPTPPEESR